MLLNGSKACPCVVIFPWIYLMWCLHTLAVQTDTKMTPIVSKNFFVLFLVTDRREPREQNRVAERNPFKISE